MKFEIVDPTIATTLPSRATMFSAGYDFHIPTAVTIPAHSMVKIPLNVKIMPSHDEMNWVLLMFIRSSMGIKNNLRLANGTGVIDPDYQREIIAAVYNDGDTDFSLAANDRICQGLILPYMTCGEAVTTKRDGGIGSTGA